MKKVYVVIFVILFFSVNSCKSIEQEIVFLRNEKLNTIRENSFVNSMENSKFKFKEVILDNEEEFNEYIRKNLESKSSEKKNFIVSEEILEFLNNNEFNYPNLVYMNGTEEDKINFKIDQTHLSYIFGIVSGMLTRTNNVAIIYSSDLKDFSENVLSFIAGVKKVNLRAYNLLMDGENVLDLSSFSEEEKIVNIDDFVKNNRSDVVFYLNNDFINDIGDISEKYSKTIFTLNEFENSSYINISYLYDDIINQIISKNSDIKNYTLSILTNSIDIDTNNLPEEISLFVKDTLNKIIDGSILLPLNLEELKAIVN